MDAVDLGLLLQGPAGCPAEHARKHIQMTLQFIVQDGAAHKHCWSLKGDAGSRFCGLCRNVFSHEQDEEGVNEVSKYTKFSQLELTESQEVFSSWDRMTKRRSNCSQAEFKMWEQATGITYNEEAVLADTSLRPNLDPCKPYKHDWMHCLMSIGILSLGVFNMLEGMQCWKQFGEYVGQWTIPSHWQHAGIKVTTLFSESRVQKHKQAEKFSCTASELLTVLPMLVHFLKKVCIDCMVQEAHCIQILAHLVDLLQSTWSLPITAEAIQDAAERALALWTQIGWKVIKSIIGSCIWAKLSGITISWWHAGLWKGSIGSFPELAMPLPTQGSWNKV